MATPVQPQPTSTSGRQPAPGELALVQDFVNSIDLTREEEELTDLNALRRWFVSRGLMQTRERLVDGDLARARAVREALRDTLATHTGAPPDERSRRLLNRAAATAPVALRLDAGGGASLVPTQRGLDGALGRLFAIVQHASAEGTWERLKACPEHDCRWAFYDHSRNRSGTWCSMRVCGNRAKARSFRARRQGD